MDKIVRKLGESLNRRGFLSQSVLVLEAFVAGVLALPRVASANNVEFKMGCCRLCKSPYNCEWSIDDCDCYWHWLCPFRPECIDYTCRECFQNITVCLGTKEFCQYAICSEFEKVGIIPNCDPD